MSKNTGIENPVRHAAKTQNQPSRRTCPMVLFSKMVMRNGEWDVFTRSCIYSECHAKACLSAQNLFCHLLLHAMLCSFFVCTPCCLLTPQNHHIHHAAAAPSCFAVTPVAETLLCAHMKFCFSLAAFHAFMLLLFANMLLFVA